MWRDYLEGVSTRGGIHFLMIVFCIVVIKFTVNKIQKIRDQEEKKLRQKEKIEKKTRLTRKSRKMNKESFYQRYSLRNRDKADKK